MLVHHQAETIAHSKPSGLDAKTCLKAPMPLALRETLVFKEIEVNLVPICHC